VCLATANLPASLTVNSLFPQSPRRTNFLAMILSRYLMPALRYTADGMRRPGVAAEKWLRLALDQLDWLI
ncbi:hypothetical protein, partial [Pseudomonas aeruginosa]|uniref:hypothetical protein n=1 Tax=Pseudomonas aeruginosa TaxID=287 RepID=UPI001B817A2C